MPTFDPAAGDFLRDLARTNTREWFTAHRPDYERLIREPLESLADEAGRRYGPGRVMRPNRDVRFSADKSPYKTNGSMWAGEVGSVYLEVDAGGISAGSGLYEPTRDQLQRARAAIDGRPQAAVALRTAINALEAQGFELAGPGLATAPRGFPKDHPDIELLRLKHYAAVRRLPIDAEHDTIVATWEAVQPLIDWTQRFVGAALSWP